MEIKRNIHLNRIIARKGNGMIKVITGMRRCANHTFSSPYFITIS